MGYAKKSDGNQAEIVRALRDIPGVSVFVTHRIGHGFPDIVIGYQGANYLVEIKMAKGKLTDDESLFFGSWNGQVTIIRNLDDALELLGIDG